MKWGKKGEEMETVKIIMAGILFLAGCSLVILALAKKNLFWTIVQEGTEKNTTLNGRHRKTLTPEGWFGGLRWVGIYPFWQVYEYPFEWTTVEEKEGLPVVVKKGPEILDCMFMKRRTYGFEMTGAETNDNMRTTSVVIILAKITDSRLALFENHKWFQMMLDIVVSMTREFYALHSFDELKGMAIEEDVAPLHSFVKKRGEERLKGIGVEITTLEIKTIDPSNRGVQDALEAEGIAEAQAKAKKATARGEAEAEKIKAQGSADALKTIADVMKDPTAMRREELKAATKIGEGGGTIVVDSNTGIIGTVLAALKGEGK